MVEFARFGDEGWTGTDFLFLGAAEPASPLDFGTELRNVNQPRDPFQFQREMSRLPEERRQLIFRIRRQIAEGTYETERKLELAVERMLESVVGSRDDD
jgi:hypothetical protein